MRDPRLAPFRGASLGFAAYLLVQAGSAAVLFALKLGGGTSGIRDFYLGVEERFLAAKSLAGILEVAVPHLAAIPLVLFAAAHVVGFARALGTRAHALLIAVSYASALAGVLASFAVRWLDPSFAWLKLAAFVGLEASLLAWATLLATLFLPRQTTARSRAGAVASEALR